MTNPFKKTPIVPSTDLAEGKLFCSRIRAWNRCKRYHYYTYIRNLDPTSMRVPFYLGSTLHHGVMLMYQGKKLKDIQASVKDFQKAYKARHSIHPEMAQDMMVNDAIGQGMIAGYYGRYKEFAKSVKVVSAEQSFQTMLDVGGVKIPFIGTVDLMYGIDTKERKGLWIEDHKTATGVFDNTLNTLPMNMQMGMYPAIVKRALGVEISGIVYSIVIKPTIRLKQNESVSEFMDRIQFEYRENPEKYFFQEFIPYNPGTVKRIWDDMMLTAADMVRWYESMTEEELLKPESWPRNEAGCFPYGFKRENACPFYDLCRDGEKAAFHKLQYFQQRVGTDRGATIISKNKPSKVKDKLLKLIGGIR